MKSLKKAIGDLDAEAAARIVTLSTDIAVMLDSAGVVRDFSVGNESLSRESDFASWIGKRWVDTVTAESRPKIEQLLKDAGGKQPAQWRQVNHPTASASDLPVRYATIQIGHNGRIVALGRELRAMALQQQKLVDAQQAMEREYARVRSAETRYRLLFQLSSDAVIILDASNLRISEANPAAVRILGVSAKRVLGRSLLDMVDPTSAASAQGLISTVRASGKAEPIQVKLTNNQAHFTLSASLFRQEAVVHMLVQLTRSRTDGAATSTVLPEDQIKKVVDKIPDAFVVAGLDRRILAANSAFLDLAQIASPEQAQGQQLDRWIGRSSVDTNVLINNLRDHGSVRHFSTIVRGEFGVVDDVEISAVAVKEGEPPCYGITIRSIGGRPTANRALDHQLPRSVQQLTGLVGQVPLKNLVRETTDMIERLCIEAALEIVGDNRASAAGILGLSRQSLYVKLRRYGLGDLDSQPE